MCLCIRSTVSNTLLMPNATVIVCAGALFLVEDSCNDVYCCFSEVIYFLVFLYITNNTISCFFLMYVNMVFSSVLVVRTEVRWIYMKFLCFCLEWVC